jgi:DNA-directed RNA polymerase subunit RPC12/RpoP
MQREELVCTACGTRFQVNDFFEELGELVACPSCGSFEIEIELRSDEAQADAA